MNTYNIRPLNITILLILFASIKNLYGKKLAEKTSLQHGIYSIYNQNQELLAVIISKNLHKLYIFNFPPPLQNNLK